MLDDAEKLWLSSLSISSNLTELMANDAERSVLRQNMVSGIWTSLAYNVARKNKNLALYEIKNLSRLAILEDSAKWNQ